jgi:hypothetical protein
MKLISYFLFYTYIGLVLLAGFWGAFLYPKMDFKMLFEMDTAELSDYARINLLSQYRFLRALELGFGLFAIIFRKEIFSEPKFNTLFLVIMFLGVMARVMSIIFDGSPSIYFYFFLIWEFLGVVFIYFYTKSILYKYANA